jgi:uncharacterized membrane protein YciS (DUF1049 family)
VIMFVAGFAAGWVVCTTAFLIVFCYLARPWRAQEPLRG